MNSSNFKNHSKTTAFKTFEHLLRKLYPKFVKVCSDQSNFLLNKLDINQFLVLLYDSVPNLKHILGIGILFK